MSATPIVEAIRGHTAGLVRRWRRHFDQTRAAGGQGAVLVDASLVTALLEDYLAMFAPEDALTSVPPPDRATELARLADFPDSLAVMIDLLQAGVQVLGAYVVENAGPGAAWSIRERNQFLGELDAIFPVLVQHHAQLLCADFWPAPVPDPLLSIDPAQRSRLRN